MNKCDPFYCEGLKRGHIFWCLTFWGGELAGGRGQAGGGRGVWGEGGEVGGQGGWGEVGGGGGRACLTSRNFAQKSAT